MDHTKPRDGGRLLVDQLLRQGVERVSCVPGESYLPVIDALRDSGIDTLVCRNEGGAALMAEAYGKLTGRPGICLVTRGPGATNACHGLHVATQDSTPMILFVGQVETGFRGRDAFQELDYRASFGGIAKWVCEIDDTKRIPELVARAFRVAMQGRPGPVVIALPEDMLLSTAEVDDAARVMPAEPAPDPVAVQEFHALLAHAEAPLLIAGGSRWDAGSVAALERFAQRWQLPAVTSFRRASLFSSTHPLYAGELGFGMNPRLRERVQRADVLLLVGGRLSEVPSDGYTLLDLPTPRQALVHVHPDPQELGRVYQPRVALNATPATWTAAALRLDAPERPRWAHHAMSAREDFLAWTAKPPANPGRFQYGEALQWLRGRLPADAIVCNGAGNYAIWLHRFFPFRAFGTQLAPTSGSMGYGVPAAIMAKRQHPERIVVALAGDGCFMMNGQEFATAVQHGIAIVVVVIDNGMYGTIRMHQERSYPGRPFATALVNPDFAALARAYGGHGECVETADEFRAAFDRAIDSGRPALLHCLMDPEAITPTTTLSALRQQAQTTAEGVR
ncbi:MULTISPECIES: thiamine pyrophosphate-binding protein [unclassified Variovorax]|uniref:thiamine pyrophosphate-binding protein n=1 Tax=Variovorax sp. Sphag1AA TaxID=2587027 RepID=UPI00161BB51A|nr:acetolactate synthase-1/2/3 large subunit [Variovorax sp. Sphag1AA]